jgi:hypothetical protein
LGQNCFEVKNMATAQSLIVVAGYLVRFPLGGYAWQAAHYLLGLRSLGYDVWFYEDTGYDSLAYNPLNNAFDPSYRYGVAAAADFLNRVGLGDRWLFVDVEHGLEYGPGAQRMKDIMRQADLLVNLGGMNHLPLEQRNGRPAVYIDFDPVFTQINFATGDTTILALLEGCTHLFTFGENIGTPRSPAPTGNFIWHPTRQPVVLELWATAGQPGRAYTTIGKWNTEGRDLTYEGETLRWCKRTEWLRCLDLPSRTNARFEMAMNVNSVAGDPELLESYGWSIVDPLSISTDPWRYRDYIRASRGEFTVAKDMNVRMRSGWFSDRSACYLAAGLPVVEQDTGFGDVLPLGPGLHAFRTVEEAAAAIDEIERGYRRASAHAAEVAREYFAAEKVLGRLLHEVGL